MQIKIPKAKNRGETLYYSMELPRYCMEKSSIGGDTFLSGCDWGDYLYWDETEPIIAELQKTIESLLNRIDTTEKEPLEQTYLVSKAAFALKAVDGVVKAAEKAVRNVTHHHPDCTYSLENLDCQCGLSDLKESIQCFKMASEDEFVFLLTLKPQSDTIQS